MCSVRRCRSKRRRNELCGVPVETAAVTERWPLVVGFFPPVVIPSLIAKRFSLASQRFKLGTFFGIGLYVHWTFSLLIVYVIYVTWASGAVPAMIAFSVAQLLAVFLCVTLHEYGHALSARRYDVGTHDITLLPIGGVARLKRIPQVPTQEFVIAIAGPAVNVVIAGLLVGAIYFLGGGWLFEVLYQVFNGTVPPERLDATEKLLGGVLDGPSLLGFALSILVINVVLVLFNLIPAFPMDGGRVLRSLLAMVMPYAPATRWAQRIGVVCAILMAVFALSSDPPHFVMVLIAAFIVYAGLAEAKQVEVRELVDGLCVGDVMSTAAPAVRADMTADQLQAWWKTHGGPAAAVVGINGIVLGHLRLNDLVTHLQKLRSAAAGHRSGNRFLAPPRANDELPAWELTAIDLADPQAAVLDADQELESLFHVGRHQQRQFAVIDRSGRLIGWLDLDTLHQRALLARMPQPAAVLETTSAMEHPASVPWSLDQQI